MIVLFGGEKGGTGKTTLAINIAILAAHDGADQILVDTDKQKSASVFFQYRQDNGYEPEILCMEKRGKTLGKDLRALADKYSLIIVDAGGQDSPELRYAMSVANEMYIPFQPSQYDLWTVDKMSELIDEVQAINPDLTTRAVFNRCSNNPRNTDADEAYEIMKGYENLVPLESRIKDRVVYQRCVRTGRGVSEYAPKDAGAEEIKNLYYEIMY